jgi:hypothetical protein
MLGQESLPRGHRRPEEGVAIHSQAVASCINRESSRLWTAFDQITQLRLRIGEWLLTAVLRIRRTATWAALAICAAAAASRSMR